MSAHRMRSGWMAGLACWAALLLSLLPPLPHAHAPGTDHAVPLALDVCGVGAGRHARTAEYHAGQLVPQETCLACVFGFAAPRVFTEARTELAVARILTSSWAPSAHVSPAPVQETSARGPPSLLHA